MPRTSRGASSTRADKEAVRSVVSRSGSRSSSVLSAECFGTVIGQSCVESAEDAHGRVGSPVGEHDLDLREVDFGEQPVQAVAQPVHPVHSQELVCGVEGAGQHVGPRLQRVERVRSPLHAIRCRRAVEPADERTECANRSGVRTSATCCSTREAVSISCGTAGAARATAGAA